MPSHTIFVPIILMRGGLGSKFTGANTLKGDLLFGYDQMHKTHQPRTMYDPNNGTLDLYWDANGNLAQVIDCKQNSGRLHEWDEENRLRFVLGDKHAGYYGYDATVTAYFAPCVEEALEAVYETSTAIKILRDGQVFIFRDDKTYTVIGQEVK